MHSEVGRKTKTEKGKIILYEEMKTIECIFCKLIGSQFSGKENKMISGR